MSKELSQFDQLQSDIAVFVAPTSQIVVADLASRQAALDALKTVKGYMKQLEAKRDELVRPLNEQVKAVNNYAKSLEAPLLPAEKHIKAQIIAFEETEEKARQEKLRKEAQELAVLKREQEIERQKIEVEAATRRQAELAALVEQQEVDELLGASNFDPEAERKALEAKQVLEEAERKAKAERDAWAAQNTIVQRANEIEATRQKGLTKTWKCEATDLNLIPREYLIMTLNSKMVLAAARGNPALTIPGVKLWQESGLSVSLSSRLLIKE